MDLMKAYSELLETHDSMRKELDETKEQLSKLLVRHTLRHSLDVDVDVDPASHLTRAVVPANRTGHKSRGRSWP
jgi:hypothetical protein